MLERTDQSPGSLETSLTSPTSGNTSQRCVQQMMNYRLLWFFAIFLVIWTLLSIAMPIILWYLTTNSYSFTACIGSAPPVVLWCKLANYILQIYEKNFQLNMAKIEHMNSGLSEQYRKK